MSIIGWVIIGALAGGLASLIMGRNGTLGWLVTIVVGIAGAYVGSLVWVLFTGTRFSARFDLMTLMISVVGAMIVLFVGDMIARDA